MANVLPHERLRAVRSSYRARLVFAGSLIGILAGTVALLALVPAYTLVKAGQQNTEIQVAELPSSDERNEIARTQSLVRSLKPVLTATSSSLALFDEIFSVRPPGVKLSSIGYVKGEPGTIAISGRASSRDDINTYRAALSGDSRFQSVDVPIGAFVGIEGGIFSMTITGTF